MTAIAQQPGIARSARANIRQRTATPPASATTGRDRSVDLVRAACLVVVVALHAMMVGVSVSAGAPVLENALETAPWFGPVSWVVQIMPLFFIVGGFASITQWRKMRATGADAGAFVTARLRRLLLPAVASVATVIVALITLSALGVSPAVVAIAGFRISQPLWFLAVYLLCQAFVPLLAAAHERRPIATVAVLLAGVVAVDAVRISTGVEMVGILNLAFVWLLVQQFGFWFADGSVDRLGRGIRSLIAAGALGTLLALALSGLYSGDMFVNLNPPTLCLVLLGTAQLALLSLARPAIRRAAESPMLVWVTDAIGSRSMTVYLWHMPILIGMAALLLATHYGFGMVLPEPLSAAWWLSRPFWLVAAGLLVGFAAMKLDRFEKRGGATGAVSHRRAAVASVLGIVSVVILLVSGFAVIAALASLAMMLTALALSAKRTVRSVA